MNLKTPEQLTLLELRTSEAQEFYFSQIEDIFWETSAKTHFESENEKILFRKKYLDLYFNQTTPVFIFLKKNKTQETVIGYLIGSFQHTPAHFELHPYLSHFESHFDLYPADLHINFSAEARGLGLGSKLIQHYLNYLKLNQVRGVHLFTGIHSRNRHFYEKNGFIEITTYPAIAPTLVMLAKTI